MSRLNTEQREAFDTIRQGKNIFLTGPAGAGKSYLIRHIIQWAADERLNVCVTALTGCAALLLGKAKTLHSWAGIGLGKGTVQDSMDAINRSRGAQAIKSRWRKTQILIVDEVSMMTPELFDKLDAIGKLIRRSTKPWGGIQLVLCGDFFQLPPVNKGLSGETLEGRFAFESAQWKAAGLTPICLKTIERQTDVSFQRVLNECRVGAPSEETVSILKTRQGLDWKSNLIRPTLLFSRNADVDTINNHNIAALNKPLFTFEAKTDVVPHEEYPGLPLPEPEQTKRCVQRLDSDANYMSQLELCVGCQVMLITNLDLEAGLVNGSRGVVIEFREGYPVVQFLHGEPLVIAPHKWVSEEHPYVVRTQVPLRVAYAITIHKSQGATLDCALVDIGTSTFEYGQAYVALSRVRDLNSLYVWNLKTERIRAHPTVKKYYDELV